MCMVRALYSGKINRVCNDVDCPSGHSCTFSYVLLHVTGSGQLPKTGTSNLKSYPASLQPALNAGEPLRANRRGVVPLSSEHDKPIITLSELIQLRRLGLSYKQIGHDAYQLTDYWKPEAGRCERSAVKALRFGWH